MINYGEMSDRYVSNEKGIKGVLVGNTKRDGTIDVVRCDNGVLEAWDFKEITWLYLAR